MPEVALGSKCVGPPKPQKLTDQFNFETSGTRVLTRHGVINLKTISGTTSPDQRLAKNIHPGKTCHKMKGRYGVKIP